MLVFNEAVKARNGGFYDVCGGCAAARDTPAVALFVPAECGLRLRAGQTHFAVVTRAAHSGNIGSQLRKPLRELIEADPIDRGCVLRTHGEHSHLS
jgi:hypothetical protein